MLVTKYPQQAKLRVGFILARNFTLTALSTFVDVLRLSADDGDRSQPKACSWHIMSNDRGAVKSSCGLTVEPTTGLLEAAELDYVVIVGGLLHGSMPAIDDMTAAYLKSAAASGRTLIGLCTGSFILCRLGLMDGRQICVSWYHYNDFLNEFPSERAIADRLFLIDSKRITCSGGTGVVDVAAHLVSKHLGASVAQKALHILLIDRARPGTSAQPAPPTRQLNRDDRITRTLLRMEQNLAVPLRISRIADDLGLSERNLERLFKLRLGCSPRQSYMQIRLRHATWMLKNTTMTLAAIANELGFVDASHLSRSFKRMYGVGPGNLRVSPQPAGMNRPEMRSTSATARSHPKRIFGADDNPANA